MLVQNPADRTPPILPLTIEEWAARERQRQMEEDERNLRMWGEHTQHAWKVPFDPHRPTNIVKMGDLYIKTR